MCNSSYHSNLLCWWNPLWQPSLVDRGPQPTTDGVAVAVRDLSGNMPLRQCVYRHTHLFQGCRHLLNGRESHNSLHVRSNQGEHCWQKRVCSTQRCTICRRHLDSTQHDCNDIVVHETCLSQTDRASVAVLKCCTAVYDILLITVYEKSRLKWPATGEWLGWSCRVWPQVMVTLFCTRHDPSCDQTRVDPWCTWNWWPDQNPCKARVNSTLRTVV